MDKISVNLEHHLQLLRETGEWATYIAILDPEKAKQHKDQLKAWMKRIKTATDSAPREYILVEEIPGNQLSIAVQRDSIKLRHFLSAHAITQSTFITIVRTEIELQERRFQDMEVSALGAFVQMGAFDNSTWYIAVEGVDYANIEEVIDRAITMPFGNDA